VTHPLTERELKIVSLVAQGMQNWEIAEQIGTTEHVVKNYLRTIYDKMGFWNRLELALWWVHKEWNERQRPIRDE
jgi:DNA-binding NarL/FixJ family response regulator